MSFFDTISRIIQQGKEMAVKATPSSKQTYNKVTPVDNSQFTSNPLLKTGAIKPAPVTFGVPTLPNVSAPLLPTNANSTRQTVTPAPIRPPQIPQPPINPLDIIRNGKEAVLRMPQGNEATAKVRPNTIFNEALFGNEQDRAYQNKLANEGTNVGMIARAKSGGILGTIASSFARTTKERQDATSQALIDKGVDPNRAIQIAYQVDASRSFSPTQTKIEMEKSQSAKEALDTLKLTPQEKRVLATRKVIDAGETALDATTFGVGGITKNVGKTLLKDAIKGKELDTVEKFIDFQRGINLTSDFDPVTLRQDATAIANKLGIKETGPKLADKFAEVLSEGQTKVPNRAGAMDVKKPNVLDKTVLKSKIPETAQEAKTSGMSFDEWAKIQNDPLREYKLGIGIKDKYVARGSVKESIDEIGGVKNIQRGTVHISDVEVSEKINTNSPRYKEVLDRVKSGERTPLVIDEYGVIHDGHHRYEAYKEIGLNKIPVVAPRTTEFVEPISRFKLKADWDGEIPPVNKKLEAYKSGKPSSEGGYIRNPLAKAPEKSPTNNQVVSSGNDSTKVYHGTNDKFDNFDKTKQKSGYYPGAYTTTDIASTKKFGNNLMEADIDAKKFYQIKDGGDGLKAEASKAGFETKTANGNGEVEYLKSKGYEGIQRGNEFIIFDPVNLKRQAPKISTEIKLTERVNYLKQFPNRTRAQETEIRTKLRSLNNIQEKKAARTETGVVKRIEQTVKSTVKSNFKLAENANETRIRMKQAEEMGLYETQKRNLTPEALDQRRLELSLQKEALDNDPANGLGKYVDKRGEFQGQLNTNVAGKGIDDIAKTFGFDNDEVAKRAYDDFKIRKQQYDLNRANLAEDIKIARQENKNIKAFNQAVSPLETITKRVSTNVARVTKRVEQKATKRQVDFEKREAKRQVATTKKVYGEKVKDEKINTQFVKRTEQKVAVRQVQFEKREARRQVIKAKTELVDKMRVANANIENIKADVVNYAKKNLPASQVGKFVSAVKNAKTQKDAIKAFNRIDNLVTEIEKKTLIRDIQKSVANLPASVEIGYANKIKELVSEINLKGYSKATVQKLEDTQKYLAEQKKLGKDVELPTRLLEKLKILGRTDAKNLTVSQLQGIQDEIELLKHLGKTKQRIKTNLYEAEKIYIADDLISTAKPLTYREIKTTPGVAQTLGIKTANKVKQVLNRLKKARLSIRPIDGLAEATGMEQVKNRIDLSYSNYLDKLDDFAKQREVVLDRLKLNEVNMERIGIYAAKQQDGGYEKLANLGITEQAANAIKLTDAEQEYYEFGRKMFDEDFDEVKAYMQDVYNKDVGKVDNYVSFQTDFNAMNELEIYDRFGTLADDAVTRTKTVKKDFTESRTGSGGQKIKLNFDSILIRHKDNVSYMLNLGKDIKMYSEVLNDPTLRSKLGDLGTFAWKEYMSLMARKGGVDSQKQIATIDILRRNLGVGVMAYKLSTALVQVSSLADAAATIGGKWVSIGVYDVASSREARKFIIDNFPEIREMIGDDIAFLELGDDWLGKVQQAGFIPLRKLDALMRSTSAIAAYRKVANEAGVAVDFAKPNKDLIQKATKLVRQSQGSSSFKDSPLALTTGAFTGNVSVDKALFQFQSFMLNRWENIERQIWREGFGSGNYVKGFTAVFWMIVAAGIIEESSRRVSKGAINLITGEDKEQDPFIETVIGNSVNNVPIVGNIMNSLAYDSNPVPFINAAESTLGGYKRAFTGVQTTTKVKGAVDAGLGTANLLFGIPGTVQAGQLIKPLIGEAKSSSNTGNKELDKAKKEDQKATKARSEGADVIVASLVGKSPEQNAEYLKELYVSDKDMYERVIKKVEQKKLNWSVEDKAIADLGVKNGAKAEYVKSQLKKMKTPEEKSAYLTDLYTRKIISKDVLDQITGTNSDIIQ